MKISELINQSDNEITSQQFQQLLLDNKDSYCRSFQSKKVNRKKEAQKFQSLKKQRIAALSVANAELQDDLLNDKYAELKNRQRRWRPSIIKSVAKKSCTSKQCGWCTVEQTPQWRTGPKGIDLCNACGLQYQYHKKEPYEQPGISRDRNIAAPTLSYAQIHHRLLTTSSNSAITSIVQSFSLQNPQSIANVVDTPLRNSSENNTAQLPGNLEQEFQPAISSPSLLTIDWTNRGLFQHTQEIQEDISLSIYTRIIG